MINFSIKYLAESANYKVISEYETVKLYFKNVKKDPIIIGDFYGDPTSAIISVDEKYIVMAGYGIIIYKLQEPFSEYFYNVATEQYIEHYREKEKVWHIEALHQNLIDSDWKYFRFIATNEDATNLYRYNYETNEVEIINKL